MRKSRPISAGLPNASPTSARRPRGRRRQASAEHDDDLDEQRRAGDDRAPVGSHGRPAGPRRVGAPAEVGDDEEEHHHHRAGVDEHLRGRDELGREEQVEHRERGEVPDQRERREERVRERVTTATPVPRQRARGDDPDDPDEEVAHALRRARLVGGDRGVVERRVGDRDALDRLREQHVLRVDQVVARVLGDLELVAERDRVERAGELAVAAEDAAAQVDLVDPRVALARRDAVRPACSPLRRRGCSPPGTRPRRASSRRTSRARSRGDAGGGVRGSAGTPAACTPGTAG